MFLGFQLDTVTSKLAKRYNGTTPVYSLRMHCSPKETGSQGRVRRLSIRVHCALALHSLWHPRTEACGVLVTGREHVAKYASWHAPHEGPCSEHCAN